MGVSKKPTSGVASCEHVLPDRSFAAVGRRRVLSSVNEVNEWRVPGAPTGRVA